VARRRRPLSPARRAAARPRRKPADLGLDELRLFPSRWAEQVRIIPDLLTKQPGPYSLAACPWIRDFLDDFAEEIDVSKGAQLAFTDGALTKGLHAIACFQRSVAYFFPDAAGASEFSAARFDPAIEFSPRLKELFTDVSNVGHKRARFANLWVRGMIAEASLKSVDPSIVVIDEFDEAAADKVVLAEARNSGQSERQTIRLSTPTHPDAGIDASIKDTDRKRWLVPCPRPRCRSWVFLDWEALHVYDDDPATARIECPRCGAPWTEEERRAAVCAGRWVAEHPGRVRSGYEIRQACSIPLEMRVLAARWLKARMDPSKLEKFMNQFGRPYLAEGIQITEELVAACVRDYEQHHAAPPESAGSRTMGVDVGTALHYRISEPREDPRDPAGQGRRVLRTGIVKDFEDLDELMRAFGVEVCVIDANPERRKCLELQERWGGPEGGRVFLALYASDPKELASFDEKKGFVSIHRTAAMDATLARFRYPKGTAEVEANGVVRPVELPHGTIDLPRGLPSDFAAQLCAPVRTYEDRGGKRVAVYRERGPDHYAHASLYDEVAALRATGGAAWGGGEEETGEEPEAGGLEERYGDGSRFRRRLAGADESEDENGEPEEAGGRFGILGRRRGLW